MSRNETLVCFFPLNIHVTIVWKYSVSHFVGSIWRTFSCLFYFIIWIFSRRLLCLPVSSRQMSEYSTNLQGKKGHHANMERCHKILSNSAVGSALWNRQDQELGAAAISEMFFIVSKCLGFFFPCCILHPEILEVGLFWIYFLWFLLS